MEITVVVVDGEDARGKKGRNCKKKYGEDEARQKKIV